MQGGVVRVKIFALTVSIFALSGCAFMLIGYLCEPYIEFGVLIEPCKDEPVVPPETIL